MVLLVIRKLEDLLFYTTRNIESLPAIVKISIVDKVITNLESYTIRVVRSNI